MAALKKLLHLDFLAGWRTLLGVGVIVVSNVLETAGIDIPGFTVLPWADVIAMALVALGIRGAVKPTA